MKCPFCGKYFSTKDPTITHIEKLHPDRLTDMDAYQALYYSTHGTINGTCMCGCGKPTEWNYKTGKPYKVSPDPECRKRIAAQADARNIRVYGKPKLLDDMNHQKDMLKHRKIAGVYTFSDGGKVSYVAKLEQNFLWFNDTIMEFTSNMILEDDKHGIEIPYYDEQDKTWRTYIPDFYLPDYNAIIEIKSSNSNPAYVKETKYKEKYKEAAVKKQRKYNYIKIVDAKYGPYVEFLADIVRAGKDKMSSKHQDVFVITESACGINDDIPMYETVFPGLHVIVTRDPFFHQVKSLAISESSTCGKVYLANSSKLVETTLQDAEFDDDEFELYRYCGSKADSDKIIRSIIDLSESNTSLSGLNQILKVFDDYNVNYNFDETITTNNAMSNFIKIGSLKPRKGDA